MNDYTIAIITLLFLFAMAGNIKTNTQHKQENVNVCENQR